MPGKHKSLFELAKAKWVAGDEAGAKAGMDATLNARSGTYYNRMARLLDREAAMRRTLTVPSAALGTCYEVAPHTCCMADVVSGDSTNESPAESKPEAPAEDTSPEMVCTTWGAMSCCEPIEEEEEEAVE